MKVTPSRLSHKILAMEDFLISSNWVIVNPVWWSSLSYQNRSPWRNAENCFSKIAVNTLPSRLPGAGFCVMPPINISISLTFLYTNWNLAIWLWEKVSKRSENLVTCPKPSASRYLVKPGKPWSRPRWQFMAGRSPTIPSGVGPSMMSRSRTMLEKNL